MNGPVRILSDLHLGHRVSRIPSSDVLRPLIAGASTVIFNGDTWQELATLFRDRSAEMLNRLQEICREEGAKPIFLSGNHDPGWPGTGWLELADGKILITHGDAFFFYGSPWSREAIRTHEEINQLWQTHHLAADDAGERLRLARAIARHLAPRGYPKGKKLWQRSWEAAHPPQRALNMIYCWLTQADAAAKFAEHYFPKAEVILAGHFHRSGIWHRRDRLVINTGSYLPPDRALWAEWHQDQLTCGRVIESPQTFTKGEILGRWHLDPLPK